MQQLNIAIIGCGSFGSYMAELLHSLPHYRISAVCDVDLERAAALAHKVGAATVDSFQRCLNRDDVAAIGLFTPNPEHAPQAIAGAKAGKHIFCEKPMAMNVEECYQMIEAADASNVRLMVGHKRRLRPQYAKMAELVRSGRFGRILAVNINGFFYRQVSGWWRSRARGGGLLPFAGVHDIDFLRYLCGEAAEVTSGSPIKTDHNTDFEDAIALLIQFENGIVASLQVCPFFPLRTFRAAFGVQIVLERGGILYDSADAKTVLVKAQRCDQPVEVFEFDNVAGFREAYERELTSFAEWVMYGTEPVLTGWDGLRCVEIMEAAALSACTGRKVSLPLPRAMPSNPTSPVSSRRLASPEIWARGLAMPEGPAFNREGDLFVANCRSDYVSKISTEGHVELFARTGGKPQGVAIGPDGSIFITDYIHRKIYRATPGGELAVFCNGYADGTPLRGPNEIAFGYGGFIYFTDPGSAWRGRACGALARLNDAGKAEILLDELEFTNGFDFSPREEALYMAESSANRILCVPLDRHGRPRGGYREFIRFDGRIGPDGIRFAANGNLYVALFGHGEVAVISPEGKIVERLRLPGLFPTNLIFRATDLLGCEAQTGAIWRLPVAVPGIPSYAQRVWAAQSGESRSLS